MLRRLVNRLRSQSVNACFCTLAIHPPYRRTAQLLLADAPAVPWIVLTDQPDDFAGLSACAIRHVPTGPMAIDFKTKLPHVSRPAYHDKRFVLEAALKDFDTAIFVDADSRIKRRPRLPLFPPGIAVVKTLNASIAEHLSRWGTERRPALEQLALHLMGDVSVLEDARWCGEGLFAVTKDDGRESKFLEGWAIGAEFLQSRSVFTGEGGVIGLAAAYAGWEVDYQSLVKLDAAIQHVGLGPKSF